MTNEDNPAVHEARAIRLLVWAIILIVSCAPIFMIGQTIMKIVEASRTPAESMPAYIQYKQKVEAIEAIINK